VSHSRNSKATGFPCRPGSSVGIAFGYGRDGPGIESRWGRDFPHLSRPALGHTQPPVQWVTGLSRGKLRPGRAADHSPLSSAVVMEEYLYPPSEPHRACNGGTVSLQDFHDYVRAWFV
jgi:hypothetical protein